MTGRPWRWFHSAWPTHSPVDAMVTAMPRQISVMAAMELGESSDGARLAIGVMMMNRPAASETPPRTEPASAARETRRCHPALREVLMLRR